MKQLTPVEIATKMQKTDENSLRLPRSFARTVSQILDSQESVCDATAPDRENGSGARRRSSLRVR